MKKLHIGGIVAGVLLASYIFGGIYASSTAETKVDELLSSFGRAAKDVSHDGVSATIFGDVTIDGLTMKNGNESVFIDTLELEGFNGIDEDSADISVRAYGIKLSGMRVDETPDNLNEAIVFQMIENDVDFEMDLSVDSDSNTIEVDNFSISGDNMGEITFAGEFEGLAEGLMKAVVAAQNEDPQALMHLMSIDSVSFRELVLTIEDDGIIDLLLEVETNERTPDIDDVREKVIAKMEKKMNKGSKNEAMIAEG